MYQTLSRRLQKAFTFWDVAISSLCEMIALLGQFFTLFFEEKEQRAKEKNNAKVTKTSQTYHPSWEALHCHLYIGVVSLLPKE